MGDDGRQPNPIFVIGAMGSGTTLLRLMLDSHERIAIPGETGFMRGYGALRFTPFKYSGRNWTKRLGWKRGEFDALTRDYYDALFMRYAEQNGKQRWGDKTPLHTWHIDAMARLFPHAQFVVMVRHPLGSVASNITRFHMKLAPAGWHWRRYVYEQVRQASRHPDRMVFLRYEDLVLQPEATLRELLDWLGEPWSDQVLEHHRVQAERGRKGHAVAGAAGDRRKAEGRVRFDDPLDVSRIDKWARTIAPEHRAWVLGERVQGLADFLGYAPEAAAPVRPLGQPGRLLATGAEIAVRIEEYPALDLLVPGPRSHYDAPYDPREVIVISRQHYRELTRPRGLRRVGIAVVRRIPARRARRAVIRPVRRLRARLGRRRDGGRRRTTA